MGVMNDIVGTGRSGVFLGLTAVVAVVTYNWIRSSGFPIIGSSGQNGNSDVFGGN
jgi:hypothetical protein